MQSYANHRRGITRLSWLAVFAFLAYRIQSRVKKKPSQEGKLKRRPRVEVSNIFALV